MKKIFLCVSFLCFVAICNAQHILTPEEMKDPERFKRAQIVPGRIENPDTILMVKHNPIVIMPPYVFLSKRQQEKYNKLVYNVKKVWPYAKLIRKVYFELEDSIAKIPTEEEQKQYVKVMEKKLRAQFEDELVRLTITQGRILIKLVDRETGSTTYEVLKELKGSFSAFLFQGIARLFGSNLKSEYDAKEEDKMIEDIIHRIENGTL
ncbi:MAG: DUF4294 domain-containing protein [Bacteroidales bacterium]|jgi:hypothetical protein|nr:DUF4294 domain-containing protein [Bacteroidales bacterium]